MNEQFKNDVLEGLSSNPKFLSSKYFYDKIGDDLFVQIMNMPEYYLTNSEFEIFSKKTDELINSFGIEDNEKFELIELGAGDGTKTKELLKALVHKGADFSYLPVDISQNALNLLNADLQEEIPSLKVKVRQGDYFEVLSKFKAVDVKKVVLFLGSNIGNLKDEKSAEFLYQLGGNLNKGDILVLGVDLIKSVDIIGPAYNDAQGITAKFNINLLHRMNAELGANFDLGEFKHAPHYDEEEGIAKSYIESLSDQEVEISALDKSFIFKEGEKIHMEISRKYNDEIISKILRDTDFKVISKILDSREYFADYILRKEA
ncbi:MAG: L-histidine N(alpha)-methyltransferase [Crocinitomicaceae bacterium]|nr:L-histidine N(alpha)-methyltransferase [Crocinitomicaceae bacterium]